MKTLETLTDLTPDQHNANLGTERGAALLGRSIEAYGAARGITTDKLGRVIAGNKTLDAAVDRGLDLLAVPSDGQTLVVIQRMDLDADTPAAKELAYLDNQTSHIGLRWDAQQIEADLGNGIELGSMWSEAELRGVLAGLDDREKVKTLVFDDRAQRTTFRRFLGTLAQRYPDPPGASLMHRLAQWIADQNTRLDEAGGPRATDD